MKTLHQVTFSQFFIFKSIIVVLGHRKIIPCKTINQLTKNLDLFHKINLCLIKSFFFKTDEAISSVAVVFQYLPFCQCEAESIHVNMTIRSCSCSFWWERRIHMDWKQRENVHPNEKVLFAMQYLLNTAQYTVHCILPRLKVCSLMFRIMAAFTSD